jgi:uncharacterized protein (TIGR03083 family)
MTQDLVEAAFRAEAERLLDRVSAESEPAFSRPSPCPPWTVGELLYHVRVGAGRVPAMLAEREPEPEPGPATGRWVSAVDYYRPDARFSAAVNDDRIAAAQRGAAALGSGAAILHDYDRAWRESWTQARQAPPQRAVLTRHGDRMLLVEFLRTRVLELAVHGLDLAAGLGRPPWMTSAAADVVTGMLTPAGTSGTLLDRTGWNQVTLVAKLTGRLPMTSAEQTAIQQAGVGQLPLG